MAFHGGFDLQVARDDRALVCRVVAAGAHAYVLGVIVVGHECETGLRRTFTALCRGAGVLDCDIMASRVWTSSCMLEDYDMKRTSISLHVGIRPVACSTNPIQAMSKGTVRSVVPSALFGGAGRHDKTRVPIEKSLSSVEH